MLSIEECEEVLNQDGESYTREEVKEIRDFLYKLGYIEYEFFSELFKQQEGDNIQPCINGGSGRAGIQS